jgi:multiple sugar transport system substrate-binding protein
MKAFTDKVGVGSITVPQAGSPIALNSLPQVGTFWISGQSKSAELASRLVQRFAEPDVQVKVAEGMNNPPMRPETMDRANVHPTFKTAVKLCDEQIFQVPDPVVRNVDVAKVYAETKPVRPGLGEIVQGAFAGDVADWRGALRKLSAASMRERERAIAAARKKGAKVSEDDFAFPDWHPARDYTANDY